MTLATQSQYIPNTWQLDQRAYWQIGSDFITTLADEAIFFLSRIPGFVSDLCGYNKRYHKLSDRHIWKEANTGLYLLIHGLNGHPSAWNTHLSYLQKHCSSAEVLAPYVPFKGNCSLEEAATPLLSLVKDYIEKHPENPICLIGASNGARIAAYIETSLPSDVSLKVSAISGPFFGARLVSLAQSLKVDSCFFSKEIASELAFGSKVAIDLLEKMRQSPEERYEFFVSKNDMHVTPWTSGIPRLNKGEISYIYRGVGHNSIIDAVMRKQLLRCSKWMEGNKNS